MWASVETSLVFRGIGFSFLVLHVCAVCINSFLKLGIFVIHVLQLKVENSILFF